MDKTWIELRFKRKMLQKVLQIMFYIFMMGEKRSNRFDFIK